MRHFRSKSGSALLIVIGMLSFLIVSAVGFAAYMRYARLPSSYLRRSVSSRHLVKAAVAEAIEFLDKSIANNPHPGIGSESVDGYNRNYWHNRVLMATNSWHESFASETVPTLCLEALGYIPPPLVNEARYFSRLSLTSQWRSFSFDVGRYAFTVLDVSDYFDINRMFANRPRSSAPNRRITLSHLFETLPDHEDAGSGDGQKWDEQFMADYRDVDSKTYEIDFENRYPLVSLADFNLALGNKGGKQGIGGMQSPFYNYIMGYNSSGFYGDIGLQESEDRDKILRMTFVTDGYFPKTERRNSGNQQNSSGGGNNSSTVYDITETRGQPFTMSDLDTDGGNPVKLTEVMGLQGDMSSYSQQWINTISAVGYSALFDYLDTDSVPISLAIPTVERTPMICGVQPGIENLVLGVKKEYEPAGDEAVNTVSESENTRIVEKTVIYKIDETQFEKAFQGSAISVLTVYPFARVDGSESSYTIDGRCALFFSSENMALRTENPDDLLHVKSREIPQSSVENGVISVKLEEKPIDIPQKIAEEKDCLKLTPFRPTGNFTSLLSGKVLLKVVYSWEQTSQEQESGMKDWKPTFAQVQDRVKANFAANSRDIKDVKTDFPAFTANGSHDPSFTSLDGLKGLINPAGKKTVRMNTALWFRVKDRDSGKVVDMVPACLKDDSIQNNIGGGREDVISRKIGDASFPLLRFNMGTEIEFTLDGLDKLVGAGVAMEISPKSAIVSDPRYNHGPEDWYDSNIGGMLSEEEWLNKMRSVANSGNRDRDIFMATSDAGYMQSIYELAHLPRFTNLENSGGDYSFRGDLSNESSAKGVRENIATSFDETRNHHLAWRTYDLINEDAEAFEQIQFTSEGRGFRVNPYSDSTNILMAVFANTPLGWKYASTNKVDNADDFSKMTAANFNKKYAFNAYTDSDAEIKWEDLELLAGKFQSAIRQNPGQNWKKTWRDLGWNVTGDNAQRELCGIDLEGEGKLWSVDKKFLYGFWSDCFAVKQQLFLVFVRAEPIMMGSGSSTILPPQLGGRGMALVWRDPAKTTNVDTPHRTRVLFYRQFD